MRPQPEEDHLSEVCRLVREAGGIDLSAYRRSMVERRVLVQALRRGCRDPRDYVACLREDSTEAKHLVECVTIKVSHFFRNPSTFASLRGLVVPDLLARLGERRPPRVWSAGCARGEEPYSLAILLEELARERGRAVEARVWGTDLDEQALAQARRGVYPESALGGVPPDLVARYFAPRSGRFGREYEVSALVRERVSFARHDLLGADDCPEGGPFDLVLCRNVLIYFAGPAKERANRLFERAVAPGGYLCLGEAEGLERDTRPLFGVIDRHSRLYQRR